MKTQGNKDERGEEHAWGSSREVGLRAGRGRAGAEGNAFDLRMKKAREKRKERNANGKGVP